MDTTQPDALITTLASVDPADAPDAAEALALLLSDRLEEAAGVPEPQEPAS